VKITARQFQTVVAVLFLSLAGSATLQAAPTLMVGSTATVAGATVALPITFNPGGASIASAQFDITLPPSVSTGTVTPGAALVAAGKTITTRLSGRTLTFLIFGMNQDTNKHGTLATLQLQVAAGTPPGAITLPISNAVFADPAGKSIKPGANKAGKIGVKAAGAH
jgi:hypothetical protein